MEHTRRQKLTPVQGRGRPRVAERLVTASFRCTESEYDKLLRMASQRRQEFSPLVRSLLKLRIPRNDADI